jgi:hypothetical protein
MDAVGADNLHMLANPAEVGHLHISHQGCPAVNDPRRQWMQGFFDPKTATQHFFADIFGR